MATYTSHYNLTKPEGTERVNIAIINQNMDSIDTQMYKNAQSIIANHGGMAIPSNNNTHAAVSSGQYVYVYNHSSLAEGLYIAKSAISTNGALSLSNLTAVSNGGLNHVYSTLNSNTAYNTLSFSSLADFKTFLNNMTVGKTSSLLLSGEASNAVCGSTYICSCNVYKIDNNFADIAWIRGNTQIGSARYNKNDGTFVINDINDMVKIKSLGIGGNQTIANIKNVCANASFSGMTMDYIYMADSAVSGWSLAMCSVKMASSARVTIWILNPSKIITIDTGNLTDWTQKTVNLS